MVLYDDNGISIDGHVEHWFADDTAKRFEGYGWNVIRGIDGHDAAAVDAAIKAARAQSDKPTLIVCRTVIGKGSPNMAGTHNAVSYTHLPARAARPAVRRCRAAR